MSIGVVILAAGESARMGEPKQLLAFRGTTLLQHSVALAHEVPESVVAVVLGAHAARIRPVLAGDDVLVVENPAWAEGMAGSIRAGLGALLEAHPHVAAALLLVCDQPLLSPDVLHDLVEAHERTGCPIAACEYGGTAGVPALFARSFFPELMALRGPVGARQIIQTHREEVVVVPCDAGAVDVDTPADYARLRAGE